jgi:ABC-2 type transport system ATP-binding protein
MLTAQPEATLREMLALDPALAGLDVTTPALEDAFLALTSQN